MDFLFAVAVVALELITWAIIIRAILSWFYQGLGRDPFTRILVELTEPLIAPVRAVLMRIIPLPIDFSPLVVILLIRLLLGMLEGAYRG